MAEIGTVAFAQVARQVAESVLPPYRSHFSKHIFSHPSLVAVLGLMRYEEWTYRETEVRLADHHELRDALGLTHVPDDTTRSRCMRRLQPEEIARLLEATIARMPPPPQGGTTVAVDGTG
jgi:hypothetical protein